MIHRLHEADAFEMLARGIPRDAPVVALDIGAHKGVVSRRILKVFPNARVYAFEPAPGPFRELAGLAEAEPRITPVQAAVGETDGEIVLRRTRNALLTSVLPPSRETVADSHGAADVLDEITVPALRLDTWGEVNGVREVDLIKLDVQGFELAALRGAGGLLARSRSVVAEAHLAPAYEGASTFSEIDLHLRNHGLWLHQIHELTTRGDDLQTLQLDGLWLRSDLLARIREAPLERVMPPWASALLGALERCGRAGLGRVALYGAGTHTRTVEPWLDARPGVEVVAVLDDDPNAVGGSVAGRPVIAPARLADHRVEGVILSSDSFEDELWRRTAGLRAAGTPVFRLYGPEIETG